jgi:hypothetical protein
VVHASGERNVFRNSAVSGVRGHGGFAAATVWSHGSCNHQEGCTWTFDDNVLHNNSGAGIRFWRNGEASHVNRGGASYYNRSGIDNGAYRNSVRYEDILIIGDRFGIIHHSNSDEQELDGGPSRYTNVNVHMDEGPAVVITGLRAAPRNRTEWIDCALQPGPGSPTVLLERGNNPFQGRFRRCGITPDDVEIHPDAVSSNRMDGSSIIIEHEDGRAWEITLNDGEVSVESL